MRTLKTMLFAAATLATGIGMAAPSAQAESVVRYGISMADIPLTTGQPDRGAGGALSFSTLSRFQITASALKSLPS